MQNTIDIAWLDVGIREDSRLAVLDHGRLSRIVAQLSSPESQRPSLCVFLGGKGKDYALQQIYTLNNIKRHSSEAHIRLRYDIASLDSSQPTLLADGDIPCTGSFPFPKDLAPGMGLPVSWDIHSAGKLLQVLWSRLVFMFADVVCIFVDDKSSLDKAMEFLTEYLRLGSASSLAQSLLPRVIFVYDNGFKNCEANTSKEDPLRDNLRGSASEDLSEIFSGVSCIHLPITPLSDTAKYLRIKSAIAEEVKAISFLRQINHVRPNGKHLAALFQSAVQHTIGDLSSPFDIVTATRNDRPVGLCAESNLTHYLEIGHRACLSPRELAPSIASALFMDHYVPGMFDVLPISNTVAVFMPRPTDRSGRTTFLGVIRPFLGKQENVCEYPEETTRIAKWPIVSSAK
ncbi:unnamed protein product [Penicillium pancosmium]